MAASANPAGGGRAGHRSRRFKASPPASRRAHGSEVIVFKRTSSVSLSSKIVIKYKNHGNRAGRERRMRLLVVEDEDKVANFIRMGLGQENYAVDIAKDGQKGLHLAETVAYDLIILDLMLPGIPGLELLKQLRTKKTNLPVLILTAKGDVKDKVAGLDGGANDYLVKPFAFAELSARVRALLRRETPQTGSTLCYADLELDTALHVVKRGGREIELKPKEFALLEYLLRNAGRPVTRTMILEHVWDIHFDSISNVVDVHINTLRNKLDKDFQPHLIHTIRGVGYVLKDKSS
jgi:heavy metal response regulator